VMNKNYGIRINGKKVKHSEKDEIAKIFW
jgi:hypothetical protein